MPRSPVLRLRQRHGTGGGGERGGEGGARSKRLSLADAIVGRSEYKFSYMLYYNMMQEFFYVFLC